jgi:LuxR family maltose regulon positive regulatory protein
LHVDPRLGSCWFRQDHLITAWASEFASAAWVSLDKGDTDPARFWAHVIAALALREPRAGTTSLAAVRARPDEIANHALPKLLEEGATGRRGSRPRARHLYTAGGFCR